MRRPDLSLVGGSCPPPASIHPPDYEIAVSIGYEVVATLRSLLRRKQHAGVRELR